MEAQDYKKLIEALRCCSTTKGMVYCNVNCKYGWEERSKGCKDILMTDAADAIEALVKRVNLSELKIKEYKGEADLYRDLYRSAHEAFLKELYGKHETLANLQSLKQSPIPYNLCPNRAQDVYNLCANYPEKPDSSESPNSLTCKNCLQVGGTMKYNIKVGEKWLIGESATETIKGTVRGDTTAVFSRMVGEMSAYDFADNRQEAASFDRITLCDYLRGIVERQNYGHYLGEIKVIPEDQEEAEAQLPKRGEWLIHSTGGSMATKKCPFCGSESWQSKEYAKVPKYCENCGAHLPTFNIVDWVDYLYAKMEVQDDKA